MRKQTKLKKILLVFVLIGALLGVQVMEIAAYAAETDTGTVEPVEVCSNFTQLYIAVNNAKDGDVIGIDSAIYIQNDPKTIGTDDKHVTIIRMNEKASFQVSTNEPCTFKNLTLDGNGITSNASIVEVYASGADFENVTFQNCVCRYASGAVMIYGKNNTFTNCTFQNNSGGTGGHLCIANDAVVTITGCNFISGSATKGGAIYRMNSGTIGAWVTIEQSKIYGNSASESGGGIYTEDVVVARNAKIFGNTAPLGEDITDTPYTSVQIHNDLETLQQIYADENIKVNGWTITLDDVTGNRYVKLDYEEIVEEPSEPSEPTDPGDTEDPDDTGGDTTDPSEPSEGEDPTEPGTGDGDQDEPTDPSQPDDSDQGTEEPSTPTDPDDSQEPGDNITTDNSDHSTNDNSNTNIDNSSNDTTTTDNSDHSSIKTDNSVTNTNSGNTTNTTSDNSQRTEDNSSVTYNYYYPSADDSEGQSQQPQQIVIHNYIQGNNEEQGVSPSQEEKVLYDPMKNVSIDAEGVDVVFEVVDGVYSISIKAREPEQQVQQAAEEPATESFMVDWYEVIKIALLGAIVFVVKKK